jgi:hypothetical protein
MTKHTIGVYKAYKNSGNLRFHRKGTKKSWKHYFIEIDDYDDEEYSFGSEWVSSLRAIFLKKKQLYKRKFQCPECEKVWETYVPKNTTEIECPECE